MRQLFIHIHSQGASWAYRQQDEGLPCEVERGPLSEIPSVDESDEIIVFVPAQDILLTSVSLPTQSRAKLQQTIPYTLEEQFVDDIESLHIAFGKQQADGRIYTATVAKNKMQSWLDALYDQGISPSVILPENLSLSRETNEWSVLCLSDGICTIRSGEQTGFACERKNIASLASRHLNEHESAVQPVGVRFVDCSENEVSSEQLEKDFGLPIRLEECNGDALASLISGYEQRPPINLCQGKYQTTSPLLMGGRRWLPAATIAAMWLIVLFTNVISEYVSLSAENDAYRDKIIGVYKQTFPDAKRIVNARVQMEQKLNALRGSSVTNEGFLSLMNDVAAGLGQVKGMNIQNLSYKQGVLDLDIKLRDIQQLDDLKKILVGIQGLDVNVQSATVKNNKLESRFRIGRVK